MKKEYPQTAPLLWDPPILGSGWRKQQIPGGHVWASPDGLTVISTVATEKDGKEWIHLSASRHDSPPSWDDLVAMKEIFGGTSTTAVQIIPPREQYVNLHPNVLHLWICVGESPLPDFRRNGCI